MIVSCWSAKGGAGTTVVAVALAVVLGRRTTGADIGSLLVDLQGDGPTVVGVPEPEGPGLAEWLVAASAVGPDAIGRLEHPVAEGVRMIPRGRRSLAGEERAALCRDRFIDDPRPVVIDVGCLGRTDDEAERVRRVMVEASATSLLVTRPCFIALRRALTLPVRPTGVVLVEEPGRALGRTDVEDVLGAPVVATVAVDAAVARAVDAGLLASRLPTGLGRSLRDVA